MEIFKNPNYNFLGWKWPLICLSLVLSISGQISLLYKGGPLYGIDFKGGTQVTVKFKDKPDLNALRKQLDAHGLKDCTLQTYDRPEKNEIIIGMEQKGNGEEALNNARATIQDTLRAAFNVDGNKPDLNNAGKDVVANTLVQTAALGADDARNVADTLIKYRTDHSLIDNISEVHGLPGVTPAVAASLDKDFTLAPYNGLGVAVVGPKVGDELRKQALQATLYALAGMLIYVGLRFEWVYGVGAIIATFHDVIITIGFFSIFNLEISLPVVAALLTLVGYSMNDTIVVFDRIRENVKGMRRTPLSEIANLSINQTLSRTILTSGLTFVTVACLFFLGGEVLRGFSFALVVGILVGTYSSIAVAAPIVVVWQQWWDRRTNSGKVIALDKAPAATRSGARAKVR
jgi:preprotein translocase subunit SecF